MNQHLGKGQEVLPVCNFLSTPCSLVIQALLITHPLILGISVLFSGALQSLKGSWNEPKLLQLSWSLGTEEHGTKNQLEWPDFLTQQ